MPKYRITKEKVNDLTVWALMEYDDDGAPWVCIDEDTDRSRLERYKKNLERKSI